MIKWFPLVLSVASVFLKGYLEKMVPLSQFLSRIHFHHFSMVDNLKVNSAQEYAVISPAECPFFYSNYLPQFMDSKRFVGLSLSLMLLALASVQEQDQH